MSNLTVRYKVRLGQAGAWSSHGRRADQDTEPPASQDTVPETLPGVPRIARLLAIAHRVERAVSGGECHDYSTAAKAFGMSQPRMAQILDLLFLSSTIQSRILTGNIVTSDNRLRPLLGSPLWSEQERRLDA